MGSSMVIKNRSGLRSNMGGRHNKDAWLVGGNWDFHALFRDHARELTHFLQRNGHDRETSRDLLQDTFVRVISKTPKKKATGHNPRAYLFKVSRNLGINLKIRQNRVPMVSLDASLMDTLVDPQPTAERIIQSRQMLTQTLKAMNALPLRSRRAFEMHRLGERTIAEIADEIGLSTTRTWCLIREAYKHILTHSDQTEDHPIPSQKRQANALGPK